MFKTTQMQMCVSRLMMPAVHKVCTSHPYSGKLIQAELHYALGIRGSRAWEVSSCSVAQLYVVCMRCIQAITARVVLQLETCL